MRPTNGIDRDKFRRIFLLLLVVGISLLFFRMIRSFVMDLLLAAILAGMSYSLYRLLTRWFRGHSGIASAVTVLLIVLLIIVPLTAFLGLVANQAVQIASGVAPWIEHQISHPDQVEQLLNRVPFLERLEPYKDQISAKVAELAGKIGGFVVSSVASGTTGTAKFLFHLFVMLYAMFFFLIDGRSLLNKIMYYMPLASEDEQLMVDRFVSVARATIKGTLVIGVVQGGLAGLAFAVVGIKGAAFWATIMVVLSVIPGIGTALVWVPAVIYLFAGNHTTAALALFFWCAVVVGTVDNVLRPRLVGKDTKMPDLLVLIGTLGGLVLFGAAGIIVGPIIAALFVTIWDLYGVAFKEYLPQVLPVAAEAPEVSVDVPDVSVDKED